MLQQLQHFRGFVYHFSAQEVFYQKFLNRIHINGFAVIGVFVTAHCSIAPGQ